LDEEFGDTTSFPLNSKNIMIGSLVLLDGTTPREEMVVLEVFDIPLAFRVKVDFCDGVGLTIVVCKDLGEIFMEEVFKNIELEVKFREDFLTGKGVEEKDIFCGVKDSWLDVMVLIPPDLV
jgi:hypothetical protein